VATIQVDDRDGARWIRLDRPPVNVVDLATIGEADAALAAVEDRKDVKCVVFASAREGVFCAGVDVRDHRQETVPEMLRAFHGLLRRLDALPQPTVVCVDGLCLGGGCELAAFCDIVLATPRSTFGQPEIDLGCFPPAASVILPRLIGRAAAEMILTGRPLTPTDAVRVGLVSRVVPDVEAEAASLVATFRGKSARALALARRAVRRGGEGTLDEALREVERLYRDDLMATKDAHEGVQAFMEKRRPQWRDE
jgi:cyclohexa-1,5-dienecarbonyl-CoA hydratase